MDIPDHVQKAVSKLIDEKGVAGAADVLGIGDATVLRIAGGRSVRKITLSLVQDRLQRRGQAAKE